MIKIMIDYYQSGIGHLGRGVSAPNLVATAVRLAARYDVNDTVDHP
jgi:hypothetical protein